MTTVEKITKLDDDDLAIMMLRKGKGKKLLRDDPRCMISCFCEDVSESEAEQGAEQGPPPEKVLLSGLEIGVFSLELKLEVEKISRNRARELQLLGSDFSDKDRAQ